MDLIIIINLCGKDDYPKFEVEEINSERAKDSSKVLYIRSHGQDLFPGWSDAKSYQMVEL